MPLKPIDLQTLFGQLDQVARERAGGKDGIQAHMQQAVQGAVEQKKREEAAKAVHQTEHPEEGAPGVKEREANRREARDRKGQGRADQEAEPEDSSDSDLTIVKDPALGARVDLSG